jgi:hypothetical protein
VCAERTICLRMKNAPVPVSPRCSRFVFASIAFRVSLRVLAGILPYHQYPISQREPLIRIICAG